MRARLISKTATGLFRRRPLLSAAVLLLASGLSAVAALPAAKLAVVNVPAQWFEGEVLSDIEYDRAAGLNLDLYIPPEQADDAPAPVVVFFYGGSWQRGRKENYGFLGTAIAERGYLVVIPDYRKFPAVRYPAFVEDGAAAVAWVHARIADYGGDPQRIFLSGHSAGAHIGAMLVSDERYLAARQLEASQIRGFAGLAGPYDFTPEARTIKQIFGPPARYPLMQTSRFIDGGEPPMLLLYGLEDGLVGPGNLERMEAALEAKGNCYQVIRYPDAGHIGLIRAFTWIDRDRPPAMADMLGYFDLLQTEEGCPRYAPAPERPDASALGQDRETRR